MSDLKAMPRACAAAFRTRQLHRLAEGEGRLDHEAVVLRHDIFACAVLRLVVEDDELLDPERRW